MKESQSHQVQRVLLSVDCYRYLTPLLPKSLNLPTSYNILPPLCSLVRQDPPPWCQA